MRNVEVLLNNKIDYYKSLELLGDAEMYDETLEAFFEGINDRMIKLTKCLNNKNIEDYVILVHDLKSDSRYLGFKKMAELAYNHEIASKSRDWDYIMANIDDLIAEIKNVHSILNDYLGGE